MSELSGIVVSVTGGGVRRLLATYRRAPLRVDAVPPAPTPARPLALARHWCRLLLLALLPAAPGGAESLLATPSQMLGPFYPLHPDPAAGNDLTRVDAKGGAVAKAQGTPLTIVGRVLDTGGRPQAGVLLEIWQTNAHGRYHHPQDHSPQPLDPQFRGYGRATTGADGAYRFVTIQPVAYPGRTPHVHFRASRTGRELLVTQMYLPAAAGIGNERDSLFMSIREPAARRRLIALRTPDDPATLRFDIVLGDGG